MVLNKFLCYWSRAFVAFVSSNVSLGISRVVLGIKGIAVLVAVNIVVISYDTPVMPHRRCTWREPSFCTQDGFPCSLPPYITVPNGGII